VLGGIVLHLSQHWVALGKHGIDIVVNRSCGREVIVAPTGTGRFLLTLRHGLSFLEKSLLKWID
jgi:hypothetical protein